MVGRIIQNVRPRKPAFAIGHAQRDVPAGPYAGFHFLQKLHGCGLMLQYFKKSYDVELLAWILFRKFRDRQPTHSRQAQLLFGKARGVSIEFYAANRIACRACCGQKIPRAAPDIQESASAWCERVAKKVFMARFERQEFFVPATVHLFIPARVRHHARLPKMQLAGGATKKLVVPVAFEGSVRSISRTAGAGGRSHSERCAAAQSGRRRFPAWNV